MARRSYYTQQPPASLTHEEAEAAPTWFRVLRVSTPDYSCDECREAQREPWVNGRSCDLHKVEELAYATDVRPADADLALKVLRAGGNPEPRYTTGIGAAQWNYKRPRKAADRDATVLALTNDTTTLREAA